MLLAPVVEAVGETSFEGVLETSEVVFVTAFEDVVTVEDSFTLTSGSEEETEDASEEEASEEEASDSTCDTASAVGLITAFAPDSL